MKLAIKDLSWPSVMVSMSRASGMELLRCCMINGELGCFITKELGLWHCSVSHPSRYPSWEELKAIRYQTLPDNKTFAILFPPMAEYISVHPNCFHLWELDGNIHR